MNMWVKLIKHFRKGVLRPSRLARLVLLTSALFVATTAGATDACDADQPDWAMETFGLVLPSPGPVAASTLPKAVIEATYVGEFRMVSLLARGAFPQVQAYWDAIEAEPTLARQTGEADGALWALHHRGLYLLNQIEAWRRAMPHSKAAQLVHAYALMDAGSVARGSAYAKDVRPERMRLKASRHELARPLLENLKNMGGHYAVLAPVVALHMRFANGDSDLAWDEALQSLKRLPSEYWVYGRLSTFARPEWSRGKSAQRLQQLREIMAGSQLTPAQKQDWESLVQSFERSPDKDPAPGAPRVYWKQRIAVLPTAFNLSQLMEFENRVGNWPEVIAVSEKILELEPHLARAWVLRGIAHKELGELSRAYEDLLTASMLGDAWSLTTLNFAYVRGGYGLTPGDHTAMYELCKLGAAMGNPAGANCLGAAHSEGFAGVKRDDREALRWHLLGARGNVRNSAHDVAVLLPRVVGAKSPEAAQAAAGFWIRAAVDEGHTFAKNKLAQHPEWQETNCGPEDAGRGGRWAQVVYWVLSILF